MNTKLIGRATSPRYIADCVAEYLKAGDLDGIVRMYHPECVIYFPLDEPPKRGHAGVREVFGPFIESRPTLISDVHGETINGDTALLHSSWRFEEEDGSVIAEGRSTEVAKQLADGSWGYYIDCPMGLPRLS